jgi:uncharacterized RDD family membrane protein YckC
MNPFRFFISLLGTMAGLLLTTGFSQDAAPVTSEPSTAQEAVEASRDPAHAPAAHAVRMHTAERAPDMREGPERRQARDRAIVKWGSDVVLPADEQAEHVGALFGGVRVEGRARGNAWAVFGPVSLSRTGSVRGNVTAVLGNVRVDGPVEGNVVSVLGGVELGPKAQVEGNVVSVGAPLVADPDARVRGTQVEAATSMGVPELAGLQAWVRHAFLWGRPLALHRDLIWAWALAGVFLALYLFIALVMNGALVSCAETLEERPGKTVLAAFLTVLLTPLLFIVLSITVVGAPLLLLAVGVASLIGKAAFLCWLGRRVTLALGLRHALPAVLVGGVLLTGLYLVPFLGFVLMKATSAVGVGMVVYALILAGRREKMATSTGPAMMGGAQDREEGNGFAASAPPAQPIFPTASTLPAATEPAAEPTPQPTQPAAPAQPASGHDTQPRTTGKIPLTAALPRAGFGIRLGALLIDFILVMMAAVMTHLDDVGILLLAVYLVVLWALKGTTVGGIICGLKIVRLDDRPLDWTTAVVRGLAGFLSVLPAGLGFLWVAFDDEKQSWHDKVAGTVVVHAPKGMSLV